MMKTTQWPAAQRETQSLTALQRIRQDLAQSAARGRAGLCGRALERGVTLFEVLIVVAILAMVAGGVAVFALPKFREAQIKTAESSARTVRTAVQAWQAANNETSCPTMSQLVQEKHIDSATNTDDPWGEPYTLTCTDDEVIVSSKGPDKKKNTADDVRVPKGAAAGGEE